MTTNTGNPRHPRWTIRHVTVDNEDFYLQRLKPLRLASLQQDPDAFGSNYAREVAFNDEAWLARLRNPLAKTFAAVRESPTCQDMGQGQPEVLGTVILYGPVPHSDGDDAFLAQSWPDGSCGGTERLAVLVYHIMGLYTAFEHRGHGIGKALIETAERHAKSPSADVKCVTIRVDAFDTNLAARSLYSRCGFAVFETGGVKTEYAGRQTFSMYKLVDCDHD